ncbi:MAG: flippase activity-associated protein Agl23 [Candidatus Hinthialibacter sp.]
MSEIKKEDIIRLSKFGIAVFVIVLLGSILRLYDLDRMAYHHDESIHAFYAHREYQGDFSRPYDPTYHGQFLYHIGALFFFLFGDADWVGRLPFAFFGVLMFYFVWLLKPWIGKTGVAITLLLVAFSPTLTYFSRFARNDIYMETMALAILVLSLHYLHSLKNRFLIGAAFFLALMYACKENSYMTGFVFGSFAVFYAVYYVFSYPREIRKRAMAEVFYTRAPFTKLLTLYALFSCAAFSYVFYVSHSDAFKQTATLLKTQRNLGSYEIGVLRDSWTNYMQTHEWFAQWGVTLWIVIPTGLAVMLFLIYGYFGQWAPSRDKEQGWLTGFVRSNAALAGSLFVIYAIYASMFTNFGNVPQGMKSGVIDYLLYWMGQQGAPRIPGPPDYYIPRLLIYEPMLVLFGMAAFLVYTWNALGPVNFAAFQLAFWVSVYAYWSIALVKSASPASALLIWLIGVCIAMAIVLMRKFASLFSFVPKALLETSDHFSEEDSPLRPDGLRILFIYWSVLSLLIYAMLEEKVPWLLVHQVLPLALLTGAFIADLWKKMGPGAMRVTFAVFVGLLAVYEARTAMQLNIYRPDDPRELMVYTQTDPSLLDVVEEIKQGAVKLGEEYTPPHPTRTIATFQGTSVWPYVWYFRNYQTNSTSNSVPSPGVPFAVVDANMEDNMKVWAKGNYVKRRLTHRGWWPPALPSEQRIKTFAMRHELPFEYARKRNKKPSEAWGMLWDYIIYRQVWDPRDRSIQPSGEKVLFYSRTPLVAPEETPQVAAGYEKPVQRLQTIKTAGRFGQGNGEFFEPRGVALSPDQSKIYVLDSRNGRIQVFDRELNFQGWFGGPGGELGHLKVDPPGNGPNGGIGVGPDGTIYVTDTWADGGGRINRYTPDGKALPPLRPSGESFFFPRGLAVAPDGTLFVADTGNNRIVKFNPDGTYGGAVIKSQVKEPVGVAVGVNGWIYVCDVGMQRVAAFLPQGQFVRQWSILGWSVDSDDQLPWVEPYVAVDARGFVYVTDSTKNTVHRFDPTGANVVQFGGSGAAAHQLRGPKGIAIDAQGHLYIADSQNHRIVKASM